MTSIQCKEIVQYFDTDGIQSHPSMPGIHSCFPVPIPGYFNLSSLMVLFTNAIGIRSPGLGVSVFVCLFSLYPAASFVAKSASLFPTIPGVNWDPMEVGAS